MTLKEGEGPPVGWTVEGDRAWKIADGSEEGDFEVQVEADQAEREPVPPKPEPSE